jgi:hypothetical protein
MKSMKPVCGLVVALSFAPRPVLAGDTHLAEALFQEGRALLDAGEPARACPKLAASYAEEPATGTLLALAWCQEQTGKIASAWSSYGEAVRRAAREGAADREQAARKRATALEARVSKLTVVVPPSVASEPGLVVRRDGTEIPPAAWSVAVPIDPGEYSIEVTANGKRPWTQVVVIGGSADFVEVVVPELPPATPRPAAPGVTPNARAEASGSDVPAPSTSSAGSTWKTVGWILGGASVAAFGAGTYFGLRARALNEESKDQGCGETQCSPNGRDTRLDAQQAGNVATLLFVGGGALLAGGVTFYLVGNGQNDAVSLEVLPAFGANDVGFALSGRL